MTNKPSLEKKNDSSRFLCSLAYSQPYWMTTVYYSTHNWTCGWVENVGGYAMQSAACSNRHFLGPPRRILRPATAPVTVGIGVTLQTHPEAVGRVSTSHQVCPARNTLQQQHLHGNSHSHPLSPKQKFSPSALGVSFGGGVWAKLDVMKT